MTPYSPTRFTTIIQYFCLVLWTCIFSNGLHAQPPIAVNQYACSFDGNRFQADTAQWKCLGPTGQPLGRGSHIGNGQMNRLRLDPRYGQGRLGQKGFGRLYAISPTGGLWRSEDKAQSWQCVRSVEYQLPANNVSDIAMHPSCPDTLFIITGDGDHSYRRTYDNYRGRVMNSLPTSGVWRSFDDGQTWQALVGTSNPFCASMRHTDASLNMILAHPQDEQTLFVLASNGVWRTQNTIAAADEVVWEHVLSTNDSFGYGQGWRGLAFHPADPNTLYASGKDIYVSKDAGNTWKKISLSTAGLDFDSLYTAMADDGFCAQAKRRCQQLYDSLCLESTLVQRKYEPQLINIATTAAAPGRLYASVLAKEQYRSTKLDLRSKEENVRCKPFGEIKERLVLELFVLMPDADKDGGRWHRIHRTSRNGISFSRMGLAVSPTDSNLIYFGFVSLHGTGPRTTNQDLMSGKAFKQIASYGTSGFHVDVHALAFESQTRTQALFIGHDGGISKLTHQPDTDRPSIAFMNRGLQTNLIFTFDHSTKNDSAALAVIGTQDCGTMVYRKKAGNNEMEWHSLQGGDGYGAQIDDQSGQVFIHANSSLYRFDPHSKKFYREAGSKRSTGQDRDFRPYDGVRGHEKAWHPNTFQIVNHPETGRMIWGFSELFERSQPVIPDSAKYNVNPHWRILTDAGKTLPDQWKRKVTEFDICTSEPDYMYFAYTGSVEFEVAPHLFRTTDGGCVNRDVFEQPDKLLCVERIPMDTFLRQGPMDEPFATISSLCAHPDNPNKVWVTFNGFYPAYKVWSWTYEPDKGEGYWQNEASESLNNLAVNGIVYQNGTNDRLYISTDAGLYFKEADMNSWQKIDAFPNVRVTELRIDYSSGKLRVATFGRGLWEGELLPYNQLSTDNERIIECTQTWTETHHLQRNLRIKKGGHLKLAADLNMPKHSRIFVERGAMLSISHGARLQNAHQQPWQGIVLQSKGNIFQRIFCKKAKVVFEKLRIEN